MSQGKRNKRTRPPEGNRRALFGPKPRKNFDSSGGVSCKACFELKNENDLLKEEIKLLKAKVYQYEKTTKKDVANAHTPSSRIDYKVNAKEDLRARKGGAKIGHKGFGRSAATEETADEIIRLARPEKCEECQCSLHQKDIRDRTIIESVPLIAKKLIYRCERGICPRCSKIYVNKLPALPKSLYGNSLIAQAMVMHFVHGITMGKVLDILGSEVSLGGLIDCFHRVARMFEGAKPYLIESYRSSICKHADETGWRTDGHSGYAWIFCTPTTSIFEFRDTRSSKVPREVLGTQSLAGTLVVDRYGGYNKMPVNIQYCYAHLLREVEKLELEFNDTQSVTDFTGQFASFLTQAMKLRGLAITDAEYYERAESIKSNIEKIVSKPHAHLGVRRVQEIFVDQRERLYHWVKSREIPAENNRAERELRPTVIARKVSFGSQSDAGAKTRGAIMSVLYTAKKRLKDKSLEEWLKGVLDKIAVDSSWEPTEFIPTVNPQ